MSKKAYGVKGLSLALCLAAGFSFSACSDDDEGSGGGSAAQEMPKVEDAGIQFPVTQLSNGYDTESYSYSADGRMTGGSTSYGIRYTITYEPLTLTEQDGDYTGTFRNIKTNSNGFMTYAEVSYSDSEYSDSGSITWKYDANGHLTSESGNITNSSDGPYSWTCTYTWENGNLMNAEYREEWEGETYREAYTFAYNGNQWENPGIYPEGMIEVNGTMMPILFYSGLLGRTTQNIPTRVTETDYEGDRETYSNTDNAVDVDYNPDGSVKSIEMQDESYGNTDTYYFGYADYPIQGLPSYSAAPAKKSPKAFRSMKERRMMKR